MSQNDENTKERTSQHYKTPSIRDLMLGKKIIKALPDNFFERVLQLEIKLKKGFNMITLQELVNYYSSAIEYFESIEDPRYRDYQVSLNLLFSQPQILKKMCNYNKVGKVNGEFESNSYANKYKKEQVKNSVKIKVASTPNNDNIEIKKLIKNVENPHQDLQHIVGENINSQDENFKKRLEEKRKKTLLSTSDITEQIDNLKNKRVNNDKNTNKSFIIEGKTSDKIIVDVGDNFILSKVNSNVGTPFINSLDASFDKFDGNKKIDEIDGDLNLNTPGDNLFSRQKSKSFKTPKQFQIFNDLKLNMDKFLSEFNYYFYEEVLQSVVEDIEKILEEKHRKTLEVSKNYNSQIKEYEFLMSSDNDNTYKESFVAIIDQLKEELNTELEKLDDQYNLIIKENKRKFRLSGLKTNDGIKLIEEKFRYDMFYSINNILYPKNSAFSLGNNK